MADADTLPIPYLQNTLIILYCFTVLICIPHYTILCRYLECVASADADTSKSCIPQFSSILTLHMYAILCHENLLSIGIPQSGCIHTLHMYASIISADADRPILVKVLV